MGFCRRVALRHLAVRLCLPGLAPGAALCLRGRGGSGAPGWVGG